MVTLDELLDTGDRQKERTTDALQKVGGYLRVGVWSVGWLLAKLVTLVLATVAGVFYVLGWTCARTVPVLGWVKTAFVLGWEAGRRGSAR